MTGYRLSGKAEEDIVAIFLEGAELFGIHQAEWYHDLLEKTFRFVADNPEAARERAEIVPPVRIHPIESHLVVYMVDDHGDVFVIRVRHRREDWQHEG